MEILGGHDAANRYICAAVRAIATRAAIPAPPTDENWVSLAGAHGVLGVIAGAHAAAGHRLPAQADRARFLARAQAERVLADLADLARVLDGAGVPWAVFTGPVISLEVYPATIVRPFAELDVLILPDDVKPVEALLLAAGATPDRESDWRTKAAIDHAELAWNLGGGTTLNVHWDVVRRPDLRRAFDLSTSDLLGRAVQVRLAGTGRPEGEIAIPTFDPLDTVVHLALHGCLSGGHRLSWLLDLQQALSRYTPAPAELAGRARSSRTALVLAVMIDRTARYLQPELRQYATALPRTTWRAVARDWSAAFPPSAGPRNGHSGRSLFAATRADNRSSVAALANWPTSLAGNGQRTAASVDRYRTGIGG